eukprot:gnl/TRDRNA2_/TRDRNA2_123061_c1_seq1.p1 gnl/TRDRNA2_/TRDRNA2_123061_c1~~gnl/TRDRNA2_/TRDRNA2_123061_c1_seq1.p1  ORF type:complete len:313 (+),score=54.74 gnl/TRDRNA2_/TRDRNA2_123061_c1_seq1:66-941(+)
MLLAPDAELYERVLREVKAPQHPEHIAGNGPEQDYLSRLFAPYWRHISVKYNYQLHHVFFSLDGCLRYAASGCATEAGQSTPWLAERLTLDLDELCIVHFSGELKMWDRDHAPADGADVESDVAFADRLLRGCSPYAWRLWVEHAGSADEYAEFGLRMDSEMGLVALDSCQTSAAPLATIVQRGLSQAQMATRRAAAQWRADLEALHLEVPSFPALPELLQCLREPSWPADALFRRGARVEVIWNDGGWYPGKVVSRHEDGTLAVEFDEAGFWGSGARNVNPEKLRPILAR